MAITATHIAAATAAIVWSAIEWIKFGKPSLIGTVTGVIAGLATVTPASGFVGPMGGLILGAAGGFICFYGVQLIKHKFKIDDSLDVFAVHGVGGILGSILVAVLATGMFGGNGLADGVTASGQLVTQAIGVGATVVWSGIATFVIVKIVGMLTGSIRVSEDQEVEGLDLAAHGERGYDLR
jgi:Amt family ammonium transporter